MGKPFGWFNHGPRAPLALRKRDIACDRNSCDSRGRKRLLGDWLLGKTHTVGPVIPPTLLQQICALTSSRLGELAPGKIYVGCEDGAGSLA